MIQEIKPKKISHIKSLFKFFDKYEEVFDSYSLRENHLTVKRILVIIEDLLNYNLKEDNTMRYYLGQNFIEERKNIVKDLLEILKELEKNTISSNHFLYSFDPSESIKYKSNFDFKYSNKSYNFLCFDDLSFIYSDYRSVKGCGDCEFSYSLNDILFNCYDMKDKIREYIDYSIIIDEGIRFVNREELQEELQKLL